MDFVNSDDESNVGFTPKPIVIPKKEKKTEE